MYDDDLEYDEDGNEIEVEQQLVEDAPADNTAIQEILKNFSGLSAESLSTLAKACAENISQQIRREISNELSTLIKKSCGEEIQRLAKEYMPEVFRDVLAKKVVADSKSWNQTQVTIETLIQEQLKNTLDALKNERTREDLVKQAINSFMSKELTEIATQAVNEFKQTTLKEVQKQAMGEIVKAVSSTLSKDTKFLAVLNSMT